MVKTFRAYYVLSVLAISLEDWIKETQYRSVQNIHIIIVLDELKVTTFHLIFIEKKYNYLEKHISEADVYFFMFFLNVYDIGSKILALFTLIGEESCLLSWNTLESSRGRGTPSGRPG